VTSEGVVTVLAPAKVNLTLHVTGRRADGYHLLDSLVVFAGVHDVLTIAPGEGLRLEVGGPHGGVLGPMAGDNIILRAARALAEATGCTAGVDSGTPGLTSTSHAAAFRGGMRFREGPA